MSVKDASTLENLHLEPGYYRFSTTSEVVYECLSLPNCKGGKLNASESAPLCRTGSGGPLCWRVSNRPPNS